MADRTGGAIPPAAQAEDAAVLEDGPVRGDGDIAGGAVARTLAAPGAVPIGKPIWRVEIASGRLEPVDEAESAAERPILQHPALAREDLRHGLRDFRPGLRDDRVDFLLLRSAENVGRHLIERLMRQKPAPACQSPPQPVGGAALEKGAAGGLEEEVPCPFPGQQIHKIIDDPRRVESVHRETESPQVTVFKVDLPGFEGDLFHGD